MNRKAALFAILAATGCVASPLRAAPLVLKSLDVTLPDDSQSLPSGPGLETTQNNCTGCHSAGMIVNQPAMPQAAWQAEVAKMRNVYKAPVNEKDVGTIVDYLTAVKGPK
jgi:cytochrome c5